ncbi:MAG TPA: shikimate dehydrogenase, partial [Aliiroseovarius sp.]|nr:shikimate dehydrogenase [Aliiroseovarius sp.]
EGGKGINVTVPFKVQAEAMADESLEAANICGAANCLNFADGRIVADNFDGVGLVRDIEDNLCVELKGKRVLFAGAGGATRGALGPFLEAGVADICVANRTVEKARDVVHLLGPRGSLHACGYDEIDHGFDVVLNATSASLTGQCPPLPPIAFEGAALAYEMVYGKGKTPFLKLAEDSGADEIADGVGMLVEQAAEAFLWWRGKRPQTAAIIADLTVPLE